MDADRFRRVKAVLVEALSRDEDTRAAFLDRVCAGDTDLRREVADLLSRADAASTLVDRGVDSARAVQALADDLHAPAAVPAPLPESIGPLPHHRRAGRGRHGRGLPRPPGRAHRARGGGQGAAPRPGHRARPGALRLGTPLAGPHEPPPHRPHPGRRHRRGRAPLRGPRAGGRRARHRVVPGTRRRPGRPPGPDDRHLPRRAARPRPGRPAPGPEAGQRAGAQHRRRGRALHHRLRHRQGAGGDGCRADGGRPGGGHAGLHEPRAAPRRHRQHRRAQRRLRPGRDALRAAGRGPARGRGDVPRRRQPPGHPPPQQGHRSDRRAGALAPAAEGRSGPHLPHGRAAGARAPLPVGPGPGRRPAALSARAGR